MNKYCLTLIIFVFSFKIALGAVKVNSIIKLDDNIPEECGLSFIFKHNDSLTEAIVYVKKTEGNNTLTQFKIISKNIVEKANIITASLELNKIITQKIKSESNFFMSGETNQDSMSIFFQEVLIGGGKVLIDESSYEIKGPIDSKVRLEYLFCTGEMFLPNYESNQNE
tara:strand:- start:292 stop:795 length:504 start_codon:yes stop_codon:yes gene_type:complete